MLRLFAIVRNATPLALVSLLLLAVGCNQDPIFDYISGETAPTKAKIRGAPSKMVSVTTSNGGETVEKLYLANGRLWEYQVSASGSRWNRSAGPGGFVADVASTSDGVLYALVIDNAASKVWRNSGSGWTALGLPGDYNFIQNIFGAGDALFATGAKRAGDDYDYAILNKNDSNQLIVLRETSNAYLTGAGKVGTNYYLAAWGQGIYTASGAGSISLVESALSGPTDVAGLLQADDNTIIGISKGGRLLYIDGATPSITVEDTSLGGTYSGALALMDSPEPQDGFDKLLLLGTKTQSSYAHGYLELRFNIAPPSGSPRHDGTPRVPGQNQPSSIKDYKQYDSSLRRYPVTALWVLPKTGQDPQVIFAATSNEGLYSYRSRSGDWEWNHEE
jgi:hypothetical protein